MRVVSRPRNAIDAQLARLAGYIDAWRRHLRHEAQFWPQLRALVAQILEDARGEDAADVCSRVLAILAEENILDLDEGREVVAWLRAQARGENRV